MRASLSCPPDLAKASTLRILAAILNSWQSLSVSVAAAAGAKLLLLLLLAIFYTTGEEVENSWNRVP